MLACTRGLDPYSIHPHSETVCERLLGLMLIFVLISKSFSLGCQSMECRRLFGLKRTRVQLFPCSRMGSAAGGLLLVLCV